MSKLTDETIKYMVARIIENATDLFEEADDDFNSGKRMAYYEVLDTIKNELIAHEQDVGEYGLDINLEEEILGFITEPILTKEIIRKD